jgi:hypothetical protein
MVQTGSTAGFQLADKRAVLFTPTIMFSLFKKKDKIVEIDSLPPLAFQRDYIDEFFRLREIGLGSIIQGRKVVNAGYGHCMDYPKGFWVEFE